jgi:hypothetical protein
LQKKTLDERNERIRKVIEKETKGKYSVFFRKSKDTNSYYYVIRKGDERITLRFSDHKAQNMKSFNIANEKLKLDSVTRYVRNRIRDLEIKNVANLIKQCC